MKRTIKRVLAWKRGWIEKPNQADDEKQEQQGSRLRKCQNGNEENEAAEKRGVSGRDGAHKYLSESQCLVDEERKGWHDEEQTEEDRALSSQVLQASDRKQPWCVCLK